MTSRSFLIATATLFVVCAAAYFAARAWIFGQFRTSYFTQFVLASALAVASVRGGAGARWLTGVIAVCGAVSSFKLAFYPYPDGSTAYGLIIPGIGFALCAIALFASEVAGFFQKRKSPNHSANPL